MALEILRINLLPETKYELEESIVSYIKEKYNFNLDRFKELRAQLNADELSEQQIYRGMLGGMYILLYDDDKLVGMGSAQFRDTPTRRQATIEDMVVDGECRGKGFGDRIVQELIDWAINNNCDTIDVLTRGDRTPAKNMYIKAGFSLHVTEHYLKRLK